MEKGYSALRKQRYRKAIAAGRQLVQRNHSSGFEMLALAYAAVGRKEEAISTLEQGVAVAPSVWLLWNLLGNHYSDLGRHPDAQRCYLKALACQKVEGSYVHFNSAIAFARAKDHESALRALDRVTSPKFKENVADFRAKIAEDQERQRMPTVWFFLVEVRALEGGEMYVPGSAALLQCCVPGDRLEDTLVVLDQFLESQHYERTDLVIAHRYHPGDREDLPPETAAKPLLEAAKTNRPVLGLFIHARDSAQLLGQMESTRPPAKRKWWWPF